MKTVLVVDDEELLREIWQEQFSEEGYNVITACSGNEGIEQLKNNSVDFIVTDLKMPKSSGFDILEYLKKENLSIPTFVCSGFMDDSKNDLESFEIKKIIKKPFDLDYEFEEIQRLVNE